MTMNRLAGIAMVLGWVSALFAPADAEAARRDQRREARQQGRVVQGARSGELTRREARGLHRQQKRLDRAQRRAAADGTVTSQEAQRLENRQDRASKNIYRQKHDEQTRPTQDGSH